MVDLNLPQRLSATFKVITPMFIGDGQQQANCVYPQSVKGALRFWWRALMWHECHRQSDDDIAALRLLHAQESALFGCLPKKEGKEEKIREAAFGLRVVGGRVGQDQLETTWPEGGNSASGYLGRGLWADKQNPHRQGFPKLGKPYEFDLIFTLNQQITDVQQAQLKQTLQLLGLFGCLGSRSRRGFGSIQLSKLDGVAFDAFNSQEAYQQVAEKLLQQAKSAPPVPYTALSIESAFAAVGGFSSAKSAHAALGRAYKNYRGQPSQMRGVKKKVFGLPLTGVDEDARRASPLLFHIYQLDDGSYGYSILHLPSDPFHYASKHQDADFDLTANFLNFVQEQEA